MQQHRVTLLYSSICTVFCLLLLVGAMSCGSSKRMPSGFDLQEQMKDGTERQKLLLSGTKHIDSAETDKVIFDIYKFETDAYPEEIRIFARIYDTTGNFITHLAPPYAPDFKYFSAITEKIGKRTENISSYTVREFGDKDSIPYSIMLTTDYSGSMKGVLDALKKGTELFVSLKQPQDRIGIATFSRDFTLKVPMWKDKDVIVNKYLSTADIGFGYYSAMYDATMSSINVLKEEPQEIPRMLVLLTDGDDNASKFRVKQVLDSAIKHKVRIFTIGFGYSKDETLTALAEATGGKSYKAYSKQELIKVFLDIYRSLRNYYYISYRPPEYYGLHHVAINLDLPRRTSSLIARGIYDASQFGKLADTGDAITAKVFFDFAQANLRPESNRTIEELVEYMERFPKLRIEIQGHTDNVGAEDFNQRLSENRAKAVLQALLDQGIESKRLRSRGFGMSQPVSTNSTEEGRQKNRRTQFMIWAK